MNSTGVMSAESGSDNRTPAWPFYVLAILLGLLGIYFAITHFTGTPTVDGVSKDAPVAVPAKDPQPIATP